MFDEGSIHDRHLAHRRLNQEEGAVFSGNTSAVKSAILFNAYFDREV